MYLCIYLFELWGTENNVWELILSFHHSGPGGSNSGHWAWWYLYPLIGPVNSILIKESETKIA